MNRYLIYTDGGSRGNPGPAAIGVVIEGPGLKKEYGEYIGTTTNNDAEYQAIIFGLKKLKQLIGKEQAKEAEVEVRADSELAVKQLTGQYKLMDKTIREHFLEIWNLRLDFKALTFTHILREYNKGADRMVNAALDKELNKLL